MDGNAPVVITSAARTPIGNLLGTLSPLPAHQLGACAIAAALARGDVDGATVDEVIMGNVLGAGQGQAPARQAALAAGLPQAVGCSTLNKMCGSGLKAIMLGHDLIAAGSAGIVVAGGMESMSNAPYLVPRARGGYRYGHGELLDHLALDGLEDAYERRTPMGVYADRTARRCGIGRERQDAFAIESLQRAQAAARDGHFDFELCPVTVTDRRGETQIDADEGPGRARVDRIHSLKPAFGPDGTVTAASAASISDGAAAVTLMRADIARRLGIAPLARIVGHAQHARAPEEFTLAPIHAIENLLQRIGWRSDTVDRWEINEAFAVVTMAAIDALRLDRQRVNVHGGACALGHPIGASGARLVATLLGALRQRGGGRGVASLCIGGGEAVALALEIV